MTSSGSDLHVFIVCAWRESREVPAGRARGRVPGSSIIRWRSSATARTCGRVHLHSDVGGRPQGGFAAVRELSLGSPLPLGRIDCARAAHMRTTRCATEKQLNALPSAASRAATPGRPRRPEGAMVSFPGGRRRTSTCASTRPSRGLPAANSAQSTTSAKSRRCSSGCKPTCATPSTVPRGGAAFTETGCSSCVLAIVMAHDHSASALGWNRSVIPCGSCCSGTRPAPAAPVQSHLSWK